MIATIFSYHNGILEKDCQYTQQYDQFTLDDAQQIRMAEFRQRYQQRPKHDPEQKYLLELGTELYQWINQRNWLDHILQNILPKPWIVEFRILSDKPQDDEADFIHLPWEILAKDGQFLAADLSKQYSPVRRLGKPIATLPPAPYKPALLFMAASPEGSHVLNYEAEEAIILQATGGLYQNNLDVFVEESGNLEQLSQELKHLNGVDILHLSCHGTADQQLVLESETGQAETVDLHELQQQLSHHQPRLIFLSACHSADSQQQTQGLTMGLIQAGYANVIGWADSVNDSDASRFSSFLYEQISKWQSLESALSQSRLQALNPRSQESIISDWHLARLYCSPEGGHVIANGSNSRVQYQARLGEKEFLGAKQQAGLQVAGRNEFVGRRRSIQHILAAWRHGKNSVLIHGMGRQGKSSLAARLANRMQHLKVVVIYGQYDAAFIAREIMDQCNDSEIDQQLSPQILQQLRDNPEQLKAQLAPILETGLLLIVDDLEQILEAQAQQRHRIFANKHKEEQTIKALIKAFHSTQTASRLLFTSRFPFDLFEQNKNWGSENYLHYEDLPAMTEDEQQKQHRLQQIKENFSLSFSQQQQFLDLVGGNPGLQSLFFTLLKAEKAAKRQALLDEFSKHQKTGQQLDHQQLNDLLEDLAIAKLLALCSSQQTDLLQALQLIFTPIPSACLSAWQIAEQDSQRLIDLGLLDVFHINGEPCLLSNPMVHTHRLPKQEKEAQQFLATQLLPSLNQYWQEASAIQAWQLVKLAHISTNIKVLETHAEQALNYLKKYDRYDDGTPLAEQLLSLATQLELSPHSWLRAGEFLQNSQDQAKHAIECYELALKQTDLLTEFEQASIEMSQARLFITQGNIKQALSLLEQCHKSFTELNLPRDAAIAKGDIARIKVNQGDVDEALKLHHEMLGVFESLGDQRSRAVTLGDIARIKVNQGEVDEALKLHHERKAVLERLGDQRSRAMTLGDIARIKVNQGEVDEALKLHYESKAVFERLGDQRERAVTLGDIARILVDKGDVDEALKLHHEEMEVYERLGDQRERAVTLNDLAQLALQGEDYESALTYFAESYATALSLGDIYGIAFVGDRLGQLLLAFGEKEEASRVLQQVVASYEKLQRFDDVERVGGVVGTMWWLILLVGFRCIA